MTRREMLGFGAFGLASLAVIGGLPARKALAGSSTTLRVTSRTLEVQGKPARVYGIVQQDGTSGLFTELGADFRVGLVNELERETLIHWHGLTPPSEQDGVPGLSQPVLSSGESYGYDFVHKRAGTHWMHSHVGLQEQQLLAAPLIVRDPAEAGVDEQEVVVLLHDFSFRSPEEIFAGLRQGAEMSMNMPAEDMAMTAPSDMGHTMDMDQTMAMGQGHGGGMVHFNDVEYDAYLANDRSLADPEVVRVDPGGQLRLRVINGSAATNFLLDLGALEGELIAVDGNPIAPQRGKQFDLAIAQRADLRLRLPAGQGAYPILALREDAMAQTGIILATKSAEVVRLPGQAHRKARPLDLKLEHNLSARTPLAERVAQRSHVLDLTGSHAGYDWGLNDRTFDPEDPLFVTEGERVEIMLRNKTQMPHPIHLHGHHFQVVAIDGRRFSGAQRDTVLVPPARSVTIAFDADNPGHWAFHCHQLYHMAAGMMTSVRYEGYERG